MNHFRVEEGWVVQDLPGFRESHVNTLLKTKIAPKNGWFPIGIYFQVQTVSFREGMSFWVSIYLGNLYICIYIYIYIDRSFTAGLVTPWMVVSLVRESDPQNGLKTFRLS